jgi:hypothetical protein
MLVAAAVLVLAASSVFAANQVTFDYVFNATGTLSITITGGTLGFGSNLAANSVAISTFVTISNNSDGVVTAYQLRTATVTYPIPPFSISTGTASGVNKYSISAVFSSGDPSSAEFGEIDVLGFADRYWDDAAANAFNADPGNVYGSVLLASDPGNPNARNCTAAGDSRKLYLKIKTPMSVTSFAPCTGRVYVTATLP